MDSLDEIFNKRKAAQDHDNRLCNPDECELCYLERIEQERFGKNEKARNILSDVSSQRMQQDDITQKR